MRQKILIVVAHLHEDREQKTDRDPLQPMIGVHVASLLDRERYQVKLHNEMWHGAYPTDAIAPGDYALVFLSGLQVDFDRMRQLSYFFRRAGTTVVAGGSICTLFPEFAARFFDAVCAGGVECVLDVMRDFEAGALKPVYSSSQRNISNYTVDYRLMRENGISVPVHYVEGSRGCNFKCDFCSIPAEGATHATYALDDIARNIDNAIRTSPQFSIPRLYPMVWFIDNNFSNNPAHMREVCRLLKADKRVKLWGALVTQDVLRNRDLVRLMAESKCRDLFTGIESMDVDFIEAHSKRQNVKGAAGLLDDVAYAQSLGIMVAYGYLFDPRMTSVARMKNELRAVLQNDQLHHPYFVAFVAPLAGTALFWQAVDSGELLPGLRLRDLDGRCIAYRSTVDDTETLSAFASTIFRTPQIYSDWRKTLRRFARDFLQHGWKSPMRSMLFFRNRLRLRTLGRKHSKTIARNYIGGRDVLDPQYRHYPADISAADKARYFEPIAVTDADGRAADWLEPYRPAASRMRVAVATRA